MPRSVSSSGTPEPVGIVHAAKGTPTTAFADTVAAETVNILRAAGCVFAEEEALLLTRYAASTADLADCVQRRASGIPLEYILGWADFAGGRVLVDAGVFVPRRRTELLVRLAAGLVLDEAATLYGAVPGDASSGHKRDPSGHKAEAAGRSADSSAGAVIVDLCCGSGAVGKALLDRFPSAEVHAADIDPAAVACARKNLEPQGGHIHSGDLFDALPKGLRGMVRLLAVNAPYVPTGAMETMPPEARIHEPRRSLDGGPDGLDIHRRVAAGARMWLAPGGHVLVETSEGQAAGTAELLGASGLRVRIVHADDLDATVVIGSSVQ